MRVGPHWHALIFQERQVVTREPGRSPISSANPSNTIVTANLVYSYL